VFGQSGIFVFLFYTSLLSILLIIGVIDFLFMLIPNALIIAGMIVVALYAFLQIVFIQIVPILTIYNILWAVAFAIVGFIFWHIGNGRWFGLGDVKLLTLLALAFGGLASILILYGAIMIAFVVAVWMLITKRAKLSSAIPFGSFLVITSFLYVFFGTSVDSFVFLIRHIAN
jgi:leader peptidase (prepilin peptidase)/N-methyltransferase